MTEYVVKIAFWLRAYDGFTIEADTDAKAVEPARIAAKAAMRSGAHPEHIEIDGGAKTSLPSSTASLQTSGRH